MRGKMSHELPTGWCNAPLFDVCRPKQWKTVSTKDLVNDGYPVYGANGRIGFYHSFNHEDPTILVTCRGATCGVLNLTEGRVWVNGNAMALDDLDEDVVSLKYAYHALRSRGFADVVTGSAQPQITRESLRVVEFPLAPLIEQQRIVAKLERLFSRVDVCQQRLAKIPALLKRFRQSVLAAACSGRLTADWREENPNIEVAERAADGEQPSDFDLPSTWDWLLSSRAFGFVTSGSRGWARYYSDNGPLFLRVGNLNHDAISLDLGSIQRVSPPSSAEGRRTKVVEGDILISITADVGMIALVEADLEEAYINQHVALARPVGNMDRRYLAYFLAAKNGGQEQFLNLQRGATKVGLGLDDIRSIWIARPPLPEQQEIVRRVESLFALTDQLEGRYAKAKAHVEKLTQSILAKAFSGELVPQDPNDEPASVLLERIKSQRPQDNESNRKTKRASLAAVC
jgi:type I restriction enzyme, S subunit